MYTKLTGFGLLKQSGTVYLVPKVPYSCSISEIDYFDLTFSILQSLDRKVKKVFSCIEKVVYIKPNQKFKYKLQYRKLIITIQSKRFIRFSSSVSFKGIFRKVFSNLLDQRRDHGQHLI